MDNLLSQTYESLVKEFGKGNFSEVLNEKKYDKKVIFANKNNILGAKGYIFYSEVPTVIELNDDNENDDENTFFALNIADNPKLALSDLLRSFHIVSQRNDDIVLFDKQMIEQIQKLQIVEGEISPFHITELGIFLSQDDIADMQITLLENKEKELQEKDAKISELEAMLAEQTKAKKTKPTE